MTDKVKYRIKVTLGCDKRCSFCINKDPKYRKKWKWVKCLGDIDFAWARSVVVSGGEPTLLIPSKLIPIMTDLRSRTNVPIYLQTNGSYLTKSLVRDLDGSIDGIGLSVHDNCRFERYLTRFKDILRIKPIRLYVQDINTYFIKHLKDDCLNAGFTIRFWSEGEFDATEKIFVLGEKP